MQDIELKRLGESIVCKEVAIDNAEGSDKTIFELEIANLKDNFEARCMHLLATALALGDPLTTQQYIEMIINASSESMRVELFINLYKKLVRHVLFELKGSAKMEAIDRLEVLM